MATALDDEKWLAIGEKLADLRAAQNLIISTEQKLINSSSDQDVRDRLQNMLQDDQKNPGILKTVIVQFYKDLTAHSVAEEQIVYAKVRSFYGNDNTQELYDEQAEMKRMLDEIQAIDPSRLADEFKSKVRQLMDVVGDHIRQEESTMFAAIDNNCSSEQKEQTATEFKAAKSQVQQEMASAH